MSKLSSVEIGIKRVVTSLFFLIIANTSDAVQFKETPSKVKLFASENFHLPLKTLLKDPVPTKLNWKILSPSIPGWIKFDSTEGTVTGNPPSTEAGKQTSLKVAVQADDTGAIGDLIFEVTAKIRFKTNRIDLGLQNEGDAFEFNFANLVESPAGVPISFSAEKLPDWFSLSGDGKLSGTPRRRHVGVYDNITVRVAGGGGSDSTVAFGEVLKTIQFPSWKTNPIELPFAENTRSYSQNIQGLVNNPEATQMSFEKVSGPAWVDVSQAGILYGTPSKGDLGLNVIKVRFQTSLAGNLYQATAEFRVEVRDVNFPPYWVSDLIELPSGATGIPYAQGLCGSAKDPNEGAKLTFSITKGPSWLSFAEGCVLRGVPNLDSVGENRLIVKVSDGELSAETYVLIRVIKSNEPPTWKHSPLSLDPTKEDTEFSLILSNFVVDPDGDPITFSLISGPNWLNLNSNGQLSGKPGANDLGFQKVVVRASDGVTAGVLNDVLFEVVHVNHPPEWIIQPVVLSTFEEAPTKLFLSPYVRDLDPGDRIQFQFVTGPTWASLSHDGILSGTPAVSDEGENAFVVVAFDDKGGRTEGRLVVRVLHVNHKPFWTQDPVRLPNATEKLVYNSSLTAFAKDNDKGEILRFAKASGPTWLSISENGSVTGTAERKNAGENSFVVRVIDRENETASVSVKITVEKVNNPPRWRQEPIKLSEAFEDLEFNFDLKTYAVDDDSDPLTFKKISGPEWMFVGADGRIKGVPLSQHVVQYQAVFEVSDGMARVNVKAVGKVTHRNHPPVVLQPEIAFHMKERETFEVKLNDPKYVKDIDNDKLGFTFEKVLPWVKLTPAGNLTLSPGFAQIGDHRIPLAVDDGELVGQGVVHITVVRDPRPPKWKQNPIRFEAKTNVDFSAALKDFAMDEDGLPIQFLKKAGPDWLTIAMDGTLLGRPKNENLGENRFSVEVANDKLAAPTSIIVTVKPGIYVQTVELNQNVESEIENLWVVDASRFSGNLMHGLKAYINQYFQFLAQAKVNHRAMMISSDAYQFDGNPIFTKEPVMKSEQSDLVSDFWARIETAKSANCCNSPIWSIFRFLNRIPNLEELIQGQFFRRGIPSEVMVVTQQRDHYRYYTQGKPQAEWKAADFAAAYVAEAFKREKNLSVSFLSPECPGMESPIKEYEAPANSYSVVAKRTGGNYYVTGCQFNFGEALRGFAARNIMRANIVGHHQLKLSLPPIETKTIRVLLDGVPLEGNSGGEKDLWKYDATKNQIEIFWYRIALNNVGEKSKITIEYRIS